MSVREGAWTNWGSRKWGQESQWRIEDTYQRTSRGKGGLGTKTAKVSAHWGNLSEKIDHRKSYIKLTEPWKCSILPYTIRQWCGPLASNVSSLTSPKWHLAIFHGIFFVCILLVFGVIVQHAVLPYSAHHPLQSSFDCNQWFALWSQHVVCVINDLLLQWLTFKAPKFLRRALFP